jgi:DNA-binding transcriptional LysR family regulator
MSHDSHYRSAYYFDAVRRYGSVREAARHLGLAASAVNRQILLLEQELGMPLFERVPTGMRLTAAGEIMARHAIAVLQDEKRVLSEFDALRGLRRGEISIIAAESLNAHFLPEVMRRMAAKYPGIRVRLHMAGSNEMPEALLRGDADLGLAFSLPRRDELQELATGKFRLGAIMPPSHPLAAEAVEGTISISQCVRHRLILPSPEISIRSLLETPLRRFGDRLQIAAESNSVTLMKTLALRLNAVAFQSRLGIEAELQSGALLFLPLARPGPVMTDVSAYLRRGRSLPVALDVFVSLVREQLATAEGSE